MVNLGDIFPNFKAESSEGPIEFHKFIHKTWAILFSHPADFTPVCTTELGCVAQLDEEFSRRGVKMIALSCDDVESHKDWIKDVNAYSGKDSFPYPIIADPKREIAVDLGLIDPEEKDSKGLPLTCRSLFIIGPDKRLKLAILYPATTGRNFREVIRVVDSLQLTANKKVATPVDWKSGDECMVLPNISTEEAKKLFPKGIRVKELPSGKGYLRYTPQPD